MKNLILIFLTVVFLSGCNGKDLSIEDPAIQATSKILIAAYIEKNPDAVPVILELNNIVQAQEYDMNTYSHSIASYKTMLCDKAMRGKTLQEKVFIITMVDMIFDMANEEFQADGLYSVEPEYLIFIKQLFNNAAQVAELYNEVE